MKGVNEALADPIEPVCPEDNRPSAKKLIVEYREKIDKIRDEVSKDPLYDRTKHDDLWLLRFYLSHKKSKPAIQAAKHTLEFRAKYNLTKETFVMKFPTRSTPDFSKNIGTDVLVTEMLSF